MRPAPTLAAVSRLKIITFVILQKQRLCLLPWHPICIAGTWTFPCRVATPSPLFMRCVYNVVLSSGHVVCINGLPFITLGHGNTTDPVLAHAFFGTQVLSRTRACSAERAH